MSIRKLVAFARTWAIRLASLAAWLTCGGEQSFPAAVCPASFRR